MKNTSGNRMRLAFLLLGSLLFSLFISGCGKGKVLPPDEVASAFYELHIYGDSTNIQKLDVKEEDMQPFLDSRKDSIKKVTKANFKMAKLPITAAQVDAIYEAQLAAYRKLTCTAILNEETKDTATVTLTTNYIDLPAADQAAADTISEKITADKLTEDDSKKIAKLYAEEMIQNFQAIEPSKDKTTVTVVLKKVKVNVGEKVKTIWMPENLSKFGEDLAIAVNPPAKQKK